MRIPWDRWAPPIMLMAGGVLLLGVSQQQRPTLRAPLTSALPLQVDGMSGHDVTVSEAEAAVAGFTDYAMRVYGETDPNGDGTVLGDSWVSVYLGFYDSQARGRTIHSPKNCMPGAGWEALASTTASIEPVSGEPVTVNRYVLQNDETRVLVLYWYQGRGRVAHNEYLVKWDLLRDAVLMRRTDEALVRIVVPISSSESDAFARASAIARELVPSVGQALPAG